MFPAPVVLEFGYPVAIVEETVIDTGLPVQVAVPLVHVADVGEEVHPDPAPVIMALLNTPLESVTVANAPAEQPLLKLVSRIVPLPENPLPPLTLVTEAKYPVLNNPTPENAPNAVLVAPVVLK
jgi:hypothetical protein